MSKITCILDDSTGLVEVNYQEGSKKLNKKVTAIDFIRSIQVSVKAKNDEGSLIKCVSPLYTEKENTRLIQCLEYENGRIIYFVQFKPRKIPVLLYERFFDDVGMPNTIFAISVVNGVWGYGGKMICVKDDIVTNDSLIYHYPFSNANDNHICLGSNKFNFELNETSVLNIPYMFFTMPNTKCSFHPSYNSRAYDYDELLRELSGKDFDNSLLVPIKSKTYKDFVEEM